MKRHKAAKTTATRRIVFFFQMLSSDKMTFLHQNVAATQVARVEVIMFGYRM